jgi:hypothetical protein
MRNWGHKEVENIPLTGKTLIFVLLCLLSSCDKAKEPTIMPVQFITFSVEGFRVYITPRVAKLVAEENGWTLKSSTTRSTFEDIIEGEVTKKDSTVWLKRGGNETILVGFNQGRLNSINYTNFFREKQPAEDFVKLYLERNPSLKKATSDNSGTYNFEHSKGFIYISIHHGKTSFVSITVDYFPTL